MVGAFTWSTQERNRCRGHQGEARGAEKLEEAVCLGFCGLELRVCVHTRT